MGLLARIRRAFRTVSWEYHNSVVNGLTSSYEATISSHNKLYEETRRALDASEGKVESLRENVRLTHDDLVAARKALEDAPNSAQEHERLRKAGQARRAELERSLQRLREVAHEAGHWLRRNGSAGSEARGHSVNLLHAIGDEKNS